MSSNKKDELLQDISSTMDGEDIESSPSVLADKIKSNNSLREKWGRYHLIRAALRGDLIHPLDVDESGNDMNRERKSTRSTPE